MQINIRYFGMIAEIAETALEKLEIASDATVDDLLNQLKKKYPALTLVQCRISINRKIQMDGRISGGDEIAVMPPFSGG